MWTAQAKMAKNLGFLTKRQLTGIAQNTMRKQEIKPPEHLSFSQNGGHRLILKYKNSMKNVKLYFQHLILKISYSKAELYCGNLEPNHFHRFRPSKCLLRVFSF